MTKGIRAAGAFITTPGVNEYDEVLGELDEQKGAKASRSVYSAIDSNPDQESALVKISRRSGVPVEALRLDNGAEARRRVAVKEAENLATVAPATANWLTNPENARVAHDDLEKLAELERVARNGFGIQAPGGSTLGISSASDRRAADRAKTIGSAFVRGLAASPATFNEGLAGTGEMIADFVDWSLQAFPDETGMRKRVADVARDSREYWGVLAKEASGGEKKAGSAESYFQQAGTSIGTSLLSAPFGIGGEGAALGMFGLASEGSYGEMKDKGLSVPMAAAVATSNKMMEGLTEKIGLDQIYKGTGPIVKRALGFLLGDLGGEEINTLYSAIADKVTIKPDMTMGDVVQQVVDTAIVTTIAGGAQGVTMHGAAKASESLFDQYQARQEARRQSDFLLSLGDSVKATKTFGRLPSAVQDLVREIKKEGPIQDVFVPVERFTELFQSEGMDPGKAAEQILSDPSRYFEAVATGGDVAIPLEEFARLADAPFYGELVKDARTSLAGMTAREAEAFGQGGDDHINALLAQAAEEDEAPSSYGTIAADYLLTGGFDVVLSSDYLIQAYSGLFQKTGAAVDRIRKKYAQEIIDSGLTEAKDFVGSELYRKMISEIKSVVYGAYSNQSAAIDDIFNDLSKYPTGMPAKVGDKISQKIEALTPTELNYEDAYQRIYDDTFGQLVGVNVSPAEAEANATLRARGLATLAQRYGYSPESLLEQFPLKVTRGDLPAALQRQPSFSEQQQSAQLSAMLDAIRSGKGADPVEMFGPSLADFLREKGVKDDRGDLAGMDVDKGIRFKKKMLRDNGLSLDKAREAAAEAGYLPEDSTVADLLDLVDKELRGSPVYAPGNTNQSLVDRQQSHDELAQWLGMMGIDLDQAANEDVIKMMQEAVAGDTLDQTAQLPETIEVDGEQRPTRNSEGRPLHFTPAGARAFWHWFGDSKAVDEAGRPLVLYHGTDVDFSEFDKGKVKARFPYSFGFHFTDRPSEASVYATGVRHAAGMGEPNEGGNVLPVYVKTSAPLELSTDQGASMKADGDRAEIIAQLVEAKRKGEPHDGVIISREVGDEWDGRNVIVFDPAQIKSVFNRGAFDPTNPSILFQSAWHGSPHTFDKFTTAAIGTGEGAQAYGYGLYFAGTKEVAEYYKDALKYKAFDIAVEAEKLGLSLNAGARGEVSRLAATAEPIPDAVRKLQNANIAARALDKGKLGELIAAARERGRGRLYAVELAPQEDEYLLWDRPLFEQSEKVKAALRNLSDDYGFDVDAVAKQNDIDYTGRDTYRYLESEIAHADLQGDRATPGAAVSDLLHSLGIRGVKYLDGSSRDVFSLRITPPTETAAGDWMVKGDDYNAKGEHFATEAEAKAYIKERQEKAAYNFVIFSDDDVAITQMYQAKRGYIKILESMPGFEIALLKDADASTFVHELGHYYEEILGRLAAQEGAPEQLRADYAAILKWLGAESKEALTIEQREKFARGFEAYLYEGSAPSQELRGVFQRFKTWLKAVYSSLKSLNVELTDEVRGVFDRLLATDQEIAAAEQEQNVKPLFATAEDAGMTPAVFEAYRELAERAHEEAKDRLERAKLREMKRALETWWKEARAKMLEEVETEAKADPVFEAIHFLRTGKLFDGSPFEGESFRLSGAELTRAYDAATVKVIRKKLGNVVAKEGGLPLAMVAEMFGFSSGDEMVKRMMEAPKLKDFVKAETDRRMNEVHGTMTGAEIAEEAIASVFNEDQAKLLREELRAIRRKARDVKPFVDAAEGEARAELRREKAERAYERRWMEAEKDLAVKIAKGAKQAEIDEIKAQIKADKERAKAARDFAKSEIPPVEFFKEAARRHIAGLTVSEILPGKFAQAEAKASRQAFELNGQGKFDEAAAAKIRQILNHYLYREATAARKEADKIAANMRRLQTSKAQAQIGKAGADYLDQVNALLERYEFKKKTGKVLAERERLLAWVERMEERNGFPPPIPASVLEDALEVNYRTLKMSELRDVSDAVKAITFLARMDGKIQRAQEIKDIHELAVEAAESIEANSKGARQRLPEKALPQDVPGRLVENYFASHRKMSSLARQMDGGQDGGVVWNLLIRPMNEAGDREAAMRADAAGRLAEIFGVYSGIERTKMHVREFIPEIGTSLSKWGRIVVALNMGNEGNLQRLGSMFSTRDQLDAVVDALDERDWQFIQNVWDYLDSFWPEIEAKEKRVNGVAPQRVEHTPVKTKYGTLPGGYWPIKYDRDETAKAGAQQEQEILKQMMGGAFARATTRRGHTEARLEAVNRPLTLSIDVLFQHLNQVIHDLTHHEMLANVGKLLGASDLQEAIRDHYGMEAYRVFSDGLRDVAIGDIPAQDAFEKFMNYTRVGISTAGLGWNLVTSLMQPLGFTQSIVRIGPKWVGKGVGRWISSPKRMVETADMIYEKSSFMKTRALTQNREIAEIRNQMTVGVIPHAVRDSFFYFIQQMQKVVDIPTWLGQYEKSMEARKGEDRPLAEIEADAIAEADQAVIDAQASGQAKDLARIQRGGPLKKMFTTFYSYFSTTYNLAAESRGRTHFNNPSEVGRFLVDMLMLYTVPVVITTMLKEGIQRAIGGGDDDDDEILKILLGEQLGYLTGGFIGFREFGAMFSGFQGYEGPAGARFYSETSKLYKEISQGEWDAGLFKRLNSVGGILLHYPATQVQRTIDGIKEVASGRGNLLSILFGKPRK